MSTPTIVAIVLTGEEVVAAAMLDPVSFVEARTGALDQAAQQQALQANRYAVTWGSDWGLLLPGDRDVSTVREMYGAECADTLRAAVATAPEQSVVAWKVMETIPRGQG